MEQQGLKTILSIICMICTNIIQIRLWNNRVGIILTMMTEVVQLDYHGDDDDDGYPAHSHHDKFPP